VTEVEIVRGNDAPNRGNGFAFGCGPVAGGDCFFGAIVRWRGFLRMCLVGERSEYWAQISMKALVCGETFSTLAIGRRSTP